MDAARLLDARRVTEGLSLRTVGRDIFCYASLPSTMDEARHLAEAGAREGTVVLAEAQTAGRGRFQRRWVSSPGASLTLSVLLRPRLEQAVWVMVAGALAVVRAVGACTGLAATIKWPNDVLVRGRKVCGVLLESAVRGRVLKYAILGIGLNVNFDPASFPEITVPATSLAKELGHPIPRLPLLRRILLELDDCYDRLQRGESLREEWRERLTTLGQRVRVTMPGRVEEGLAEDVDAEGRLLVRRPDGSLEALVAGEVTLRGGLVAETET